MKGEKVEPHANEKEEGEEAEEGRKEEGGRRRKEEEGGANLKTRTPHVCVGKKTTRHWPVGCCCECSLSVLCF